MKRIALMLLVVLVGMYTLTMASAETLSISTCSDAELIALLDEIQAEITARNIQKTAFLQAGSYIGGRDIPVGDYILTSAGGEEDSGIVSLRSVNDPLDSWPSKLYEYKDFEDHFTVYITVEEGDTLELPYPYNLTISAGIQFK